MYILEKSQDSSTLNTRDEKHSKSNNGVFDGTKGGASSAESNSGLFDDLTGVASAGSTKGGVSSGGCAQFSSSEESSVW